MTTVAQIGQSKCRRLGSMFLWATALTAFTVFALPVALVLLVCRPLDRRNRMPDAGPAPAAEGGRRSGPESRMLTMSTPRVRTWRRTCSNR